MAGQIKGQVPRIRFKAYSQPWADEKIGDVLADKRRPIVLEDNQRYELITVKRRNEGVVSRGHLLGRDILVKNYAQLKAGDFVISKRQVVHGATGIVPPELDGAIVSNEYLTAVDSYRLLTEFLAIVASLPAMRRKFFLSSYGVDIEKLFFDADDWKKRNVTLPDVQEQSRVGQFFRKLDELLDLHERKHGKLAALKAAMLQKMFPKPGENVPEVRFKEFSGDWLPKKLGEMINLGSGRDYKHLLPGDIPVYGTGGYMLSVSEALSNGQDAVGIGRKGTIDKPYILKAPFWTVDTLFYATPKSGNDLDFVYCIFQRVDWRQKDESTGVPSLSKGAINGVTVMTTNPPEQQKVGAFFGTLNSLIAEHATQILKLRQVKAAFLDQMFA